VTSIFIDVPSKSGPPVGAVFTFTWTNVETRTTFLAQGYQWMVRIYVGLGKIALGEREREGTGRVSPPTGGLGAVAVEILEKA
jgi:hypothetical protein